MNMPEPHEVFFDTWSLEASPAVRMTPVPEALRTDAPAFQALERARLRAEHHAEHVLGWSTLEARLAAGQMAIILLRWLRDERRVPEQLQSWLRAYQEKGRAEAVLGHEALPRVEAALARQLDLQLGTAAG